jgi:hypothetical protein
MTEGKQKFIIVLLVINLIVVSYFGVTIKNNIEDSYQTINSQIQNVKTTVYNLENRISDTIEDALEQEKNRIEESNFKYQKIDIEAKKAVIYFSAKLESLSANSKILLAYNEENSTSCKEVEMKKINGLTYGAIVDLSIKNNYEYDIIERSNDGAEVVLNIHKKRCSLYDEFFTYRISNNNSGNGRSRQSASYNMGFAVNDFDLEEYGVDKIQLKVYYDDKLIKEDDVTDKVISGIDQEAFEKYKLAVASGEIVSESVEARAEYMSNIKSDDTKLDNYFYEFEIVYKDYPELDLDMDKAENISIEMIVTCKDGYSQELWYGRKVVEKKHN